MTALVPALQAVVRDELAGVHMIELGIVTATFTNEGGSGDTNLAVNARLRGSALELQHIPVAVGRLGPGQVLPVRQCRQGCPGRPQEQHRQDQGGSPGLPRHPARPAPRPPFRPGLDGGNDLHFLAIPRHDMSRAAL